MVRTIIITLLSFLFSIPAAAQDYFWAGWGGPDYTNPAWGHEWVDSQNFFHNGWGEEWQLGQDPADFYPNAGSAVTIPAGFSVDIEGGQPAYCATLDVPEGATLLIPYSTLNTTGPTLQVDGLLHMTSYAGSNGTIHLHAPLSVEGTGTVLMVSGRFIGDGAIDLMVGPGMTIRGGGSFGWTPYGNYLGVNLTNHGTILATESDAVLTLLGMDVVNTGTVGAQDGAELRLYGQWDGTGGTISAESGAMVYLYGDGDHTFGMEGGTFRTDGGEIRPIGATVRNVVNEGALFCDGDAYGCTFNLAGDGLINTGELVLAASDATDVLFRGALKQRAGRLRIDDRVLFLEGGLFLQGGVFEGMGDIQGPVTGSGGTTIHPGREGAIGTLTFGQDANFTGSMELVLEKSATGMDRLNVGGTLHILGHITVRLEPLIREAVRGEDVVLISAGAIEGDGQWTLILPDGWSSSGLEVVGHTLVARDLVCGLSGTPQPIVAKPGLYAAPNPFNPRTEVRFNLLEPGFTRLWVADLQGRRVADLLAETRGAGPQSVVWEGTDSGGRALGSGVYLCVLETPGGRVSRRLTLVR